MMMNAALYDAALWPIEKLFLQKLRQRLVSGVRGRVLEIGVGTGANLPYYSPEIELTGIDPDEGFLARARRRAQALGRPVTLLAAHAEELPFADRSFDTVVATLVFCTVADPQQALREVHRVLVPGGEFKLIEHVRVRHIVGAIVQDLLTPLWRRIANNCHLNRDTLRLVQANGFQIELVREHLRGLVIEVGARTGRKEE
ncbi:MAG: class I SAM-dependent methyltransferase [Candidatus Bipolaricaulota bacterium]|nr:class I SAM-dependent methyltransferase [Candidatus Bipolaricaulota bacterium]